MRKALVLAIATALALGVFGVAHAGGWGLGVSEINGWGRGTGKIEKAVEELGLTDQQLAEIRSIQQEMYSRSRDLRIKLMDAMFELRQLKFQKNPDQSAVEAKQKEISDIRSQLQQIAQDARQKMESVLTQEQKDKIQSLRGFRPGCSGRGFRGRGFGPRQAPAQPEEGVGRT